MTSSSYTMAAQKNIKSHHAFTALRTVGQRYKKYSRVEKGNNCKRTE
jgi:hypothetical protein